MKKSAFIDQAKLLREAFLEKDGQEVEFSWLSSKSGFGAETLRTYIGKNMLAPHVIKISPLLCKVIPGFSASFGDIVKGLSQRDNLYEWEHIGVSELVSSLIERSRTNAGLALELINRPEMANRIDAFVLLFVTAWEQLLKAAMEIEERDCIFTGDINKYGQKTTVGFSKALEVSYPSRKDPVRRNIEVLKSLRDGAAHLLVPEVVSIVSRYFQASVLNYIQKFHDIVGESPFRFEGTGVLTMGVAYQSPRIEALRVKHGQNAEEIKSLIGDLEARAREVKDHAFAISIDYQLILEKKPGPNAIRLVSSEGGASAAVVKVPRDPKKICPHTTTQVAEILKKRTGDERWNKNYVAVVAEYLGVKENDSEYHYGYPSGGGVIHSYSDAFVDRVLERLNQDPELVKNAYTHRAKGSHN